MTRLSTPPLSSAPSSSQAPLRAGLLAACLPAPQGPLSFGHRLLHGYQPLWGPALALAVAAVLVALQANQAAFLALNQGLAWLPGVLVANLTALGDTHVALALLLPFAALRRDAALAVLLALLVGSVAIHTLKAGFDAARPAGVLAADAFRVVGPALRNHAFPSGHSATAFMVAGLLLGWSPKVRWAWLVLALACATATSRVVVGAHWPLDVLVGGALGWCSGLAGLWLAQRATWLHKAAVHWGVLLLLVLSTLWLLTGFDSGYAQAWWLERLLGVAGLLGAAWGTATRLRR